MSGRLNNKTAFITGGASGIGAATARLFAAEGAKVTIADLDVKLGEALARELDNVHFEQLDVTDEAAWQTVMPRAVERMGRLDIMVNSAGISDGGTNVEECSLAQFNKVLAINLAGTFLGCQNAVKAMKGNGSGSIINMSSVIGLRAAATRMAYGASKAAVAHLTKSAALHCGLAGYNIRVNAIFPGPVDTPILDEQLAYVPITRDEMLKIMEGYQALQRIAQPAELAAAILYLASDDSRFVTASDLVVDGGFSQLFAERRPD